MKVVLDLPNEVLERINENIGSLDLNSVTTFVITAIRNELERAKPSEEPQDIVNLARLAREIDGLQQGQRLLFMLIDGTATTLANLIRRTRSNDI